MSPDTITVHITNSLLCRDEIGKSNTLGSSLRDSPQRKGKHAFSEVIRQPTDPYCRTSFHNYTHSINETVKNTIDSVIENFNPRNTIELEGG